MDELGQLNMMLHDLCQPLTTLQCRLEMATLVDTLEEYREAVALALAQCVRLAESVRSMREVTRVATEKVNGEETQMAEDCSYVTKGSK